MQWLSTVLEAVARPFKWWVVVAEWEQGLRVRLGKNTKRLDPGIHLRIPFLDRIFVQSVRLRVACVSNQSISTKDGMVITFGIGIRYQVCDIKVMYSALADVEGTLMFDALSSISGEIATHSLSELTPASLEEHVNAAMRSDRYGLRDVRVSVFNFCVAKCYRFISGDSWIPKGTDLDREETTGERC